MTLTLPIDPASLPTAQQKGVTRDGRVYTKAKVLKAHRRLVWLLREAFFGERCVHTVAEFDAARPGACVPWHCTIVFVYPTGRRPHRFEGKHKATRPDVDNVAKLVLDAITDACVAWVDDGQVASLYLCKRFSGDDEPPHIEIQLEPKE